MKVMPVPSRAKNGELRLNGHCVNRAFNWNAPGFCYFCGKSNNLYTYYYYYYPISGVFSNKRMFCPECHDKFLILTLFIEK